MFSSFPSPITPNQVCYWMRSFHSVTPYWKTNGYRKTLAPDLSFFLSLPAYRGFLSYETPLTKPLLWTTLPTSLILYKTTSWGKNSPWNKECHLLCFCQLFTSFASISSGNNTYGSSTWIMTFPAAGPACPLNSTSLLSTTSNRPELWQLTLSIPL